MRHLYPLALLLAIIISSCQPNEKEKNNSVNGIWESIGSGWVLQIQDSAAYSLYDITSISCLPNRIGAFEEIQEVLKIKNDTLSLLKGVMTYNFVRQNTLPEVCLSTPEAAKQDDPLYNFEVFAETVREHYAFFKLNNLRWDELYEQQKDRLAKDPTDVKLYLTIEEILEKLNDNHAYLEATEDVYEAVDSSSEDSSETNDEQLPEYGDFQVAQMVAKHHMQEEMTEDSWLIQWGKLNETTGYIQLKAMWLYADLDIPKALIEKQGYVDAYVTTFHQMYEGAYIEKEVFGVRKIMDKVMEDLSQTTSMVIDVRFNGGGQDAVNFEILRRFNPERRKVVMTRLKHGKKFSPLQSLFLEASPKAYTNPVYVLTSQQTGSAAEALAIGAISLPHFTIIGSNTQGALSTALEKSLPNGWAFSISNEIYMDKDGNSYENVGVPPDYRLNYPEDRQDFFRSVVNNLEKDKADILEAIEALDK
ncbi:S41 family peptidase [Poritiphilus flavus]|uniref:Tail specific protease domain-containing protein n=1 Tax=Poritiphilus flavus TaxID=2697053 RepID=A0A6L9EGQ5_9FLAO|nr:S41 family peptidase [Poritiphilus flavus]NAS13875.1 hypothetical protein [Poritiphilus flavus]